MKTSVPESIILFDGVCAFCNRSVNFIIDHDPEARFHFAPLQSSLAEQIFSKHALCSGNLSSVVLVEDGQLYFRSTAALRIARQLSGPVRLLGCLLLLPRDLRDAVYDWFARNRYRWFGSVEACRRPEGDVARRFL